VRRAGPRWAPLLAGGVVITAGFGVALVEAYRWPKGSLWLVVGAAVLLLLVLRVRGRRGQ
jgi:hypothetical protein